MNISDPISAWVRALTAFGRAEKEPVGRLNLIGLDMAPQRHTERDQMVLPTIAAAVLGALLLVGLRMDVVRMSYASADSVALERALLDEKRDITVSLLRLRDPKLLGERAAELGFAKADRVINLSAETEAQSPPVRAEHRP